ncbi:alpha-2-macroglobulin family protein [Variovorax atrisoli]|uniref:alpha-2-macroglobulin family protein n=1 Tax=Variovorax atrisoli TaxID=3394203 RepID=UPI000F7E6861|nr:alpha-2-macroglobulin [Variovorax sp. 369]RTD92553.1 alpha-2-macroglobulin family protein [Variovorax sp. 369]
MLQVANRKLASISDVLFTGLGRALGFLRPLARGLIGSWRPPGWLRILGAFLLLGLQWLQQRLAWLVLLVLIALAGWIAHPHVMKWWHGLTPDRVEPVVATAKADAPQRTQIELDKGPNPFIVNFSASVAPIARIGQEATGVTIEPAIAGRWTWTSQKRLEFLPAQDWPVGQPYKVQIADSALAPHIELAQRKYEFTSPEFTAQIIGAEFYQDPVQANVRRALFQVRFSHPVNTAEFEKRLVLTYDQPCSSSFFSVGKCASEKFTVSYDKLRLIATLQSEPLPIPEKNRPAILSLTAGAVAQKGGPALRNDQSRAVDIPGLYSLSISGIEPTIVTGENGEPEHVMQVSASMPVHEREMARVVQAWLLPVTEEAKGDPAEKFDWSADPSKVTDAVLRRAKKLNLQPIASEREVTEMVSFRMPQAEGGRYLLVRVAKGLKTPGGYQLGAARQDVRLLKTFAPELSIMSQGSLLALSGERKLPILVRDLPGIRLEIGRLLPQQLQHLVTQTSGDFAHPQFYGGLQSDNLVDRFQKEIPLSIPAGKAHYETVDFADYLRSDATDRRGVFLLKVQGYDPKAKKKPDGEGQPEEAQQPQQEEQSSEEEGSSDGEGGSPEQQVDQRLVLVTDLGIVAKKSLDGTRDVFVQSIASGQPVAGAMVEVWGRNGMIVASQSTDATGAAKLPNLAGYQREKAPVVLVVRKDGDLSFLPFNRSDRTLDISRFDVGGLRAAGVPNQMTAYVFSDRGIYRPGDTMHIAMMVKAGNWGTSLRDLPLEAEIIDARGLSVRREKLRLGPGGAAEIAHTTQDTSPTGNYAVNLYLPRQSSPGTPEVESLLIGSTTVKVQEFLPDRTKVTAKLSNEVAEGWVSPKDLKAQIDVQNLFGTPAPDRKVEGTLTLSPGFPVFRAFTDYAFFDPQRATEKQVDDLGSVQTSAEGKAEFDLRLSRFDAATYQVHVLAKAFEPEGGRSVSAEAQTLVSDLPYLVGVKVDGDTSYVSKGATRNATVIAIDPRAKKTAVADLKIERVERKVLSVLIKQDNGLYRYESRLKEIVLDEKPFAIAAAGNNVALDTSAPGNFAYVMRNAQGMELNRVEYSVAGNANVSRSLDRNAELQLTLDRKDYEPGQEISVSIRAPYVGAGLITIERDKVYAHAWFKTDKTASVQKITVPKDFEGTGYINVHFVRDPASDEVYMSPLSYGVVPFATALARRTANLQLTSSELVKPGQTMKMKLTSDKPTRAVVFAVDEGILQVARYKTPDPLKHFFQKRALEVGTLQTLDLILPEFKKLMQGAAPGGDGEGELGKHLNPFKRKRDKPVAYWSGLVDVNGSREFSYTVPESFNGSLRVMAVAVNDETTGAKSTRTVVRGDMVILPNAPLAMAPGDTVEVGVGLANNIVGSGREAPIALTLTASGGLEVVGDATQTLKVNERGEASTKFNVRAKPGEQAVLGSSALVFTSTHKNYSARLSTEVSVRPASPFVTLVQAGSFQRAGEISSQTDLYPNFRQSDVAVSAAPWAFATGLMQYLEAYPHGCTEQITSQTFPAVLLSGRPELVKEMSRGRTAEQGPLPEARKTFERYLVQLRARQTADGGFSLWPGAGTDAFATLYAVQLLVEAKDHKLPVPQDLLQKADTYLQGWLGSGDNTLDGWRQRAQAAYLLTRQGIVAPAALANLREARRNQMSRQGVGWGDDLGAVYLAASYQLVKQEQVANELLDPVWSDLLVRTEKKQRRNAWGAYYDPLVHDSMTLHLVGRHFPSRLKALKPAVWEGMAEMVREGWYNSLSSASMLLAVDSYFEAVGQNVEGKLSASAVNAQGQAAALALGSVNPITRAAVPAGTARLKLSNDSDFNLYYSWAEQGFERNVPATPVNKGMEIFHEVLDAKGNPITKAKLGEEVTVRVRVRSLERAQINDVALVDVLPGGLEPVLQAVGDDEDAANADAPIWKKRLGGGGSWKVQYADIREDRVVFYGGVGKDLLEVTYKARATNVGDYVVPAAYGEAMYDRRVFSRSAGARFQVVAN